MRRSLVLFFIFLAALGIRLYDLSDLPLDFNPTRQLFSMLKARGLYYALSPEKPAWQRDIAAQQLAASPVIEPPVMEILSALGYKALGGENLALPRLLSSLFWLAGGFFLYRLASDLTEGSFLGAVIALLYYLFLPFGIYASRSFQPDPLMTLLIVAALWAAWQWRKTGSLRWALTVGLLNGAALFVKNVAVFFLLGASLALLLENGLLAALKNRQTWLVVLLSVAPVAGYTLYGTLAAGFLGQQFGLRFFPELWTTLSFYLRWKGQWDALLNFGAVCAAALGVFAAPRRAAWLLTGLWLGYLAYGFTFAYHITTHDYYQLPLIPIVALSLAPAAALLEQRLQTLRPGPLPVALLSLLIGLTVTAQIWAARVELAREDFRPEAAYLQGLGNLLGHDPAPVLCLCQDYGDRLEYWGWQPAVSWLTEGDLQVRSAAGQDVDLKTRLGQALQGKKFFVITHLGQLEKQPDLKTILYTDYPIYAEGKGYVIFKLQP